MKISKETVTHVNVTFTITAEEAQHVYAACNYFMTSAQGKVMPERYLVLSELSMLLSKEIHSISQRN